MNNDERAYQWYLMDLVTLFKEYASEAKKQNALHSDSPDRAFYSGQLLAFYKIFSTMCNQAETFGIPLETIGLDSIDPDKELI